MKYKLGEIVKKGNIAKFSYFRDGNLWYTINYNFNEVKDEVEYYSTFDFPIPISDTGTATFLATDKAVFFMRWVRKHIEMINNAQE